MSNFYLEDDEGNIYERTTVSSITIDYSSQVSDYPIEAGFNVSDNTTLSPVTMSYKGIISEVANLTNLNPSEDVTQVIKDLVELRNSRKTFTVYYDNRGGEIDSLPPLDTCVFTRLSFSRNSGQGYSYDTDFSIKQLILSEQATLVEELIQAPSTNDQAASEFSKGTNSTKEVKVQEDLLLRWANTLGGGL